MAPQLATELPSLSASMKSSGGWVPTTGACLGLLNIHRPSGRSLARCSIHLGSRGSGDLSCHRWQTLSKAPGGVPPKSTKGICLVAGLKGITGGCWLKLAKVVFLSVPLLREPGQGIVPKLSLCMNTPYSQRARKREREREIQTEREREGKGERGREGQSQTGKYTLFTHVSVTKSISMAWNKCLEVFRLAPPRLCG